MRRDLEKHNLLPIYPMYPYELATVAMVWYAAQLRKKGYLEMDFSSALLVNSPQYLHNTMMKQNAEFLLEVYDWAGQTDTFDMVKFFQDFKYSCDNNVVNFKSQDLVNLGEFSQSLVRVYLAMFRMTMALAQHYVTVFSKDGQFSRSEMIKACDFKIEKENPFIELVSSLADQHYNRAWLFCFLTTCPSGELKAHIELDNSVIVYDAMSPFSNLTALYNNPQNYINIVDWMNI
jgi:hypothetical protein